MLASHQNRNVDVRIIDAKVETLTNQDLGKRHQRTLTKVVRTGLEAEPDHPDPAATMRKHELRGTLDVKAVAAEQAA